MEEARLQTAIGTVEKGKILVRGYPLEELIGNLTYAAILFLTMKGELPTVNQEKMMNAVLAGITDHFFINAAVPAARFVVAGNPTSPTAGVAAGILSLGGVTGSPQESGEFIEQAYRFMKQNHLTLEEAAKQFLIIYKDKKKRIPGFGHILHPEGDPRAIRLRQLSEKYGILGEKTKLYEEINRKVVESLGGKKLPINVDGMMAACLSEMEIDPLYMGCMGVVSFLPGIISHVVEEIKSSERVGIRRSFYQNLNALYTGPAERHLPKEFIKN